jgi:hypothetical protein
MQEKLKLRLKIYCSSGNKVLASSLAVNAVLFAFSYYLTCSKVNNFMERKLC